MAERTVEERLDALERDVAWLKQRLGEVLTRPNWLEQISGSMKDYPEFEEVVRLGREIRQADRPPDLD